MVVHLLFDLLAWAMGLWMAWHMRRRFANILPSPPSYAQYPGYYMAILVGLCLGATWIGSINMGIAQRLAIGHSVAGALAGGILAVEIYKRVARIQGSTGVMFVAPLALGIGIGRWGCFFAGIPDYTYGIPTDLPWAVDFGDGVSRHPVQIYESTVMLLFLTAFLYGLKKRASWACRHGFYFFTLTYGSQRFLWEFLKPYPAIFGPFNLFHIVCLALCLYSLWGIKKSGSGNHA